MCVKDTEYTVRKYDSSVKHRKHREKKKRERQREREQTTVLFQENNTLYIGCGERRLLYKFIWTDKSIDTYFNAHQ